MIRGKVDRNLQARVTVEVMDRSGQFESIGAVLDTGFTGALTLPRNLIQLLRMTTAGERTASLANGEIVNLNCWHGLVHWHGERCRVLVLQTDGQPLLGMSLLQGSRVTLDVLDEGNVAIDKLSYPYD